MSTTSRRPRSGLAPRPDPLEDTGERALRHVRVVGRLCAQPVAARQAEEATQAEVRVRGDGASAGYDLTDPLGWHTDLLRETVLADAQRQEKLILQQFAWRNRCNPAHLAFPQ